MAYPFMDALMGIINSILYFVCLCTSVVSQENLFNHDPKVIARYYLESVENAKF